MKVSPRILNTLAIAVLLLFTCAAGTVQAQQVPWVNSQQANTMPLQQKLNMRGKILSVLEPAPSSKGPITLYLVDAAGRVQVIIFQQTWDQIPDKSFIVMNAQVDIHGITDEFRGTRQVIIEDPKHIRLVPGTAIPQANEQDRFIKLTVAAINASTIGMMVTVEGEVTKHAVTNKENVPTKILLKDRTGEIEIIYWMHTESKIPPDHRPMMGKPLRVSGFVSEYRGKLQLRVDEHDHILRPDRLAQEGGAPAAAAQTDPFGGANS